MLRKQEKLRLQEPRIFLSYAKEDKEKIRNIYRRLQAERLNPWIDVADLLPGEDWDKAIIGAIRTARFVIVFLSNNSVNKRGYVQKEIAEALDAAERLPESEIYIIPVRLEECFVPDRLSRWQYIDIFRPNGFKRVVNTIKRHLGLEENEQQPRTLNRKAPSRDSVTDLLLVTKFRENRIFLNARLASGKVAISDGYFMEIRKTLPRVFSELRYELDSPIKLTEDQVNNVIPPTSAYRKEKNLLKEIKLNGPDSLSRVLVSRGNTRCSVDKNYINYIMEKYPEGKVYITGKDSQIIVENDDTVVCVFMPRIATDAQLAAA